MAPETVIPDPLKSCPFCGGPADPQGWKGNAGRTGPECESCGATAEDIESWNLRVEASDQ